MEQRSISSVEGPWSEPPIQSGLIERCREHWNTPLCEVPNNVLATFLRQRLGLAISVPEAELRIATGFIDDTELYDEELYEALSEVQF